MLALPPGLFSSFATNLGTSVVTSLVGQSITTANGSKSSWTGAVLQGDASSNVLLFDVDLVGFMFSGCSAANTRTDAVIDLGVDPAGGTSYTALISDLLAGWTWAVSSVAFAKQFWFPIHIPRGSTLGLRGQSIEATPRAVRVTLWLYGGARPDMWWKGSGVETLGVTAPTGTSHTPGNSSAFSTFASVGGTTLNRFGAIQLGVQGTMTDTVMQALAYHWEMGYGSAKVPGAPTSWAAGSTSEAVSGPFPPGPVFCDIAKGTQMQVRGACSGTAEPYDVGIYGVY